MRGAVFVIGLALASTSLASTGRAEPPAEEVSAPEAVEPVESSEARAARQEARPRSPEGSPPPRVADRGRSPSSTRSATETSIGSNAKLERAL